MEELLERIAVAMETANILNTSWIELNKQWRQENVEKAEREAVAYHEWLEWQRQQKQEERERLEQWQDAGIEKIITARKEHDELMLALQREMLTGETHNDG